MEEGALCGFLLDLWPTGQAAKTFKYFFAVLFASFSSVAVAFLAPFMHTCHPRRRLGPTIFHTGQTLIYNFTNIFRVSSLENATNRPKKTSQL